MTLWPAFFLIALTLLSACSTTGYQRSYITTDTLEEQILPDAEKR